MENIINETKKYKLDRPITGIIHKDRIWEQWYDPEKMKKDLPKMNQTDYMLKCNEGFEEQIIINNRGLKNISNQELKKMIDKYVAALVANGIVKGDIIATIGLTTPELITLKYAAAKIGAITANLNFSDSKGELNENLLYKQIKLLEPKMIFTLDILENKVSEILNLEEFKRIVKIRMPLSKSTPLVNSERLKIELLKRINIIKKENIKNSLNLNEFIKSSYNLKKEVESVYELKMPSNIAFTSGTTGENKAVLLSHDANNALAMQHDIAGLGLNRGEKNLALVPPFLAIWDADIIHMAMCLGIENILELSLTYENVPKCLAKYLPQYGIWSQYLWESLLYSDEKEIQKVASNLKKVVVGGERADINPATDFYNKTGLMQEAGFGATEMDSCFTVAHPNCNVAGSAGLPLPFNNVRIVDENMKDLTYNKPGRVLITGPCMMNGYYKRDDLTKKVLITDNEGTVWYNTGDYGFVDNTGSLTILDRYKEPIIINSKRINLIDVSEKIKQLPFIKLCKTTNVDGVIISHIVLSDFSDFTKNEMIEQIHDYLENNLSNEEKPNVINVMEMLPRTPLGKVDYVALQKISDEIMLSNGAVNFMDGKLNFIDNIQERKLVKKI